MIVMMDKLDSIFDGDEEIMVIPVNTVGVMGAGLAKDFAQRFPACEIAYKNLCKSGTLRIGKPFAVQVSPFKGAILFPTKKHWSMPSALSWIEIGLDAMVSGLIATKWNSVAIPAIGCGLGELNWDSDVFPLIKDKLSDVPSEFYIYPPR